MSIINTLRGVGVAVISFAVDPAYGPSTDQRRNDSQPTIRIVCPLPETYVCFPVTRADDRGTHSEKKGPLLHVNPAKVREEKARLAEEGMGWYRKGKLQHTASIFHDPWHLKRYLLSQDVPADSNKLQGQESPKARIESGVS